MRTTVTIDTDHALPVAVICDSLFHKPLSAACAGELVFGELRSTVSGEPINATLEAIDRSYGPVDAEFGADQSTTSADAGGIAQQSRAPASAIEHRISIPIVVEAENALAIMRLLEEAANRAAAAFERAAAASVKLTAALSANPGMPVATGPRDASVAPPTARATSRPAHLTSS